MPRIPLSQVLASCEMYGVLAAWPEPRRGAPEVPFQVVSTKINPEDRYGLIKREKELALRNTDLVVNDLIYHVASGVVCRVVQRVDPWTSRIEAWTFPQSGEEMEAWIQSKGGGTWVCFGQCATARNQLPPWWVDQQVLEDPAEIDEAMGLDPERPGFEERFGPAARPEDYIRRETREREIRAGYWQRIKAKLRKLAKLDEEEMDEYADKRAIAGTKAEDGVEVKKFVLKDDEDDEV